MRVRTSTSSTAVKIHLSTVQETANSSAWNHIFQFRRRSLDGKSRKLLSLPHTHESAPWSPYLPCQIIHQGVGAEWRNILQEKLRGRGGSSCRFERRFGKNFLLWALQHKWVIHKQHYWPAAPDAEQPATTVNLRCENKYWSVVNRREFVVPRHFFVPFIVFFDRIIISTYEHAIIMLLLSSMQISLGAYSES